MVIVLFVSCVLLIANQIGWMPVLLSAATGAKNPIDKREVRDKWYYKARMNGEEVFFTLMAMGLAGVLLTTGIAYYPITFATLTIALAMYNVFQYKEDIKKLQKELDKEKKTEVE